MPIPPIAKKILHSNDVRESWRSFNKKDSKKLTSAVEDIILWWSLMTEKPFNDSAELSCVISIALSGEAKSASERELLDSENKNKSLKAVTLFSQGLLMLGQRGLIHDGLDDNISASLSFRCNFGTNHFRVALDALLGIIEMNNCPPDKVGTHSSFSQNPAFYVYCLGVLMEMMSVMKMSEKDAERIFAFFVEYSDPTLNGTETLRSAKETRGHIRTEKLIESGRTAARKLLKKRGMTPIQRVLFLLDAP